MGTYTVPVDDERVLVLVGVLDAADREALLELERALNARRVLLLS